MYKQKSHPCRMRFFIIYSLIFDCLEYMRRALRMLREYCIEGMIINEEAWGMKKLAYPIQKKSTGFYQMVEFKAEPTVVDKLEVAFRRDERVMRYLTVKMEKYAAEYAAKRRNKNSN